MTKSNWRWADCVRGVSATKWPDRKAEHEGLGTLKARAKGANN